MSTNSETSAVIDKMAVHYSSATDMWSTPQDLFDRLDSEFSFTEMPKIQLLTEELQDAFCKLLKKGFHESTCCQIMGLSKSTYDKWKKWGEDQEEGIYADFLIEISKSKSEPLGKAVKTILDHIEEKQDGYLALKWLQTRYPGLYGKYAHLADESQDPDVPVLPQQQQINQTNILAISLQSKLLDSGLISLDQFNEIIARVTGVQQPPKRHVMDTEFIDELPALPHDDNQRPNTDSPRSE